MRAVNVVFIVLISICAVLYFPRLFHCLLDAFAFSLELTIAYLNTMYMRAKRSAQGRKEGRETRDLQRRMGQT